MVNNVSMIIAGEEIVPCDISQTTLQRKRVHEDPMKSFNFFRPDTDLPVYCELCGIVFKLGHTDPLARSFMEAHNYRYDKTQLHHLEQLLAHNLMQEQAEWEFVDDRDF